MGFLGSLEKMLITAYQKGDFTSKLGEFSVYINPASYSQSMTVKYNDRNTQGSSGGSPNFNRILSGAVTLDLVFDGTGVVPTKLPGLLPFTADGVTAQVDAFKRLTVNYNGNIHSTNYLELTWGSFLFRCRLCKLDLTYTLFKPDGTPLRAKAKATFIEYTGEKQLALKARPSSPDLTHVRTVLAGDTLPLMCFRIYGTSAPYLQVARVNGLIDFRQLTVGSQLFFPPMEESLE